jgi:hypothetical protein
MTPPSNDREKISRTIARIQASVLALACALIGGLGLFLMTVWLVIKDGPQMGLHLQLLANYFPGYSVTWTGSVVGLLYGALTGGVIGWTIGTIYNRTANLRQRSSVARGMTKD